MGSVFDKLKDINKSIPPKQKIIQVKESKRDNEKSYMLWLNKDLLKEAGGAKMRRCKVNNKRKTEKKKRKTAKSHKKSVTL